MQTLPESNNVQLLTYLHERSQHEIDFLRERQHSIFTWSSNILLLLIGALLIVDNTKTLAWTGQGLIGKLIASLAVVVLTTFSIGWQQRLRHWQEESIEVRDTIQRLLHCYDKGYFEADSDVPLYPERWAAPHAYHKRIGFWKRISRINYVSASVLLSALTIAMIWLASY